MNNLLMSEAVGDIAGSAYEGRTHRTKDYNAVKIFSSRAHFTDDTVCTFACAEAFLKKLDMGWNLWKCSNEHRNAGFGSRYKQWMECHDPKPYRSFGNGSAMRCSSAAWMAKSEEECIDLATKTAMPTHNHKEGIKGAVVAALTTFHLKQGQNKKFIRENILAKYYPQWKDLHYDDFHDNFRFNSTCPGTVPPAIICFLDSTDYIDCIRLAISLGGDADTLAAITGPMAYAFYKEMPDSVVYKALRMLPDWMQEVNAEFDKIFNNNL